MSGAVFAGIATLDVVQYDAEPIRPGHKTKSGRAWLGAGGPATNAAICCAHLTGSATLVSAIGRGPAADLVRAELDARGVTLIDCAPDDFTIPVAAIAVTGDGERTVVSPGATTSPVAPDAAALAVLTSAEVLLVDGHHPGLGAAARAAVPARGSGSRPLVVVDAGSVKPVVEEWLTDWIDVVAASADYAAGLGGDAGQAIAHILAAGAGAAIITGGADDVHWATDRGRTGRHSPPQVTARDTLGAGDAFHGALVAALTGSAVHWREQLPAAVRTACAVASAAVADPSARGWLTPELGAASELPLSHPHRRS